MKVDKFADDVFALVEKHTEGDKHPAEFLDRAVDMLIAAAAMTVNAGLSKRMKDAERIATVIEDIAHRLPYAVPQSVAEHDIEEGSLTVEVTLMMHKDVHGADELMEASHEVSLH